MEGGTIRVWDKVCSGSELRAGGWCNTDRDTQSRIAQAVKLLDVDQTLTEIKWKVREGVWMAFTKEQLTTIAVLIGRHVQMCYQREYELHLQVDQCSTVDEVLSIEW